MNDDISINVPLTQYTDKDVITQFKQLAKLGKAKLKKKENDKVIQLFAANLQHTYGDEMIVQQLGQDDSYIGQHLKVPSMITVHLMRLFCQDYEKNKKSWDNITIDSVLFLLSRITNETFEEAYDYTDDKYHDYIKKLELQAKENEDIKNKLKDYDKQQRIDKNTIERLLDENNELQKQLDDQLKKSFNNKTVDMQQEIIQKLTKERDIAIKNFERYKKAFEDISKGMNDMSNVENNRDDLKNLHDNKKSKGKI